MLVGECSRQDAVDIPEPSGAIERSGEKDIVLNRAELNVLDQAGMTPDGREQRCAIDIPNTDRALQRSRRQVAIVLTEDAVDFLVPLSGSYVTQSEPRGLAAEHIKQASRLPVPEPCAAIERYRRNSAAVVTEHHALQLCVALVTSEGRN